MHSAIVQRLSTDKTALSDWLAKLNQMNGIAASNEAYKLTAALKKEASKIDPEALRQAVMQMTPMVLYLSDFLEKNYLEKIAPRIAKLNTHLLRQLAALHIVCADTTETGERIQHYNYALQMQGIVHYLRVLGYERPSSSLWAEMGTVYQAALDLKITGAVTNNLPPAMKKLDTIEKVVKRNLLFAICNAYCLPRPHIQALFRFCTEQHAYLELSKLGDNSNEGFCWPYSTKRQPYAIRHPAEGNDGIIFNAEPLIMAQRQGVFVWPIPEPTPILHALTHYKILLKSQLTALSSNHVFISEFDRVVSFFSGHIRLGLAWPMNSPIPEHLNFSSLELAKDDQNEKERVSHEEIWGRPKDETLKLSSTDFGAIKTVRTDTPGFFICDTIRARLRDQDLLALYGKDLKPYLAIVRRLEPGKVAHMQKALIEILPGAVKTVTVLDEKSPATALLYEYKDRKQLFIAPEKFATGSELHTNSGPITLDRLVEETPYFLRYQTSVVNETGDATNGANPATHTGRELPQ